MALRFMDGFDYYNTSQLNRKWSISSTPTIVASPIRNGAGALRLASTIQNVTQTIDAQASWIIGFGFQIDNISTSNNILDILDTGTIQLSLRINGDGTLEILRSGTAAVTGGASTLSLSTGTWYFIELKVTIADSIGADSCKVRVNGMDWLTVATGQDLKATANATANGIRFKNGRSGTIEILDDVYICDGTGTKNNDFLGDVKVVAQFPDGDGNVNNFTRSAGATNFDLVNENPADDDTTYNESSTVDHVDLYTFDNLATSPLTIFGVQVNMVVKKDDAGARTIRALTRPTSVNIEGAIKSPSNGSYTNEMEVWEDDPQAVAAWTESTFNASEFGITIEA